MNALYQALRALDPHQFELMIFHLMKERYPRSDLKHIEGSGGDEGVDVICGQLDDRPTIWQCKAFPNGIKDSQKQQIKASLSQALLHHTPRRWILCLSIDLDPQAWRWFQRLAASRAKVVHIELMQASDIVQQLLYRQTLREQFFPATILNTVMLRECFLGTRAFTIDELTELNDQNVNSYLARLEAHDARFAYAITYSRNQQPTKSPDPAALVTMTTGDTTIAVYPRDHEALRVQPLRAKITLKGQGVERFMEHLQTGNPQKFVPGEITSFTSDFDFLRPSKDAESDITLYLDARSSSDPLPLRMTLGIGDSAVVYEYILFRCTRAGTHQATYESIGGLPLRMEIVLRSDGTGTLNFANMVVGHDVHEIQKFLIGIAAATAAEHVGLYDLSNRKTFLESNFIGTLPTWVIPFTSLINDAVKVADTYRVTLLVPSTPTPRDASSAYLLAHLPEGVAVPIEEITLDITKSAELSSDTKEGLRRESDFRITTPTLPTPLVVFDMTITPGPIQYDIRARIKDPDAAIEFFERAPLGANTTIVLIPTRGTVRLLTGTE